MRDERGVAVVRARFLNDGASAALSAVTDDDGRFSLEAVAAADGKLTVEAAGFARHTQVCRSAGGVDAEIDLVLAPRRSTSA